MSRYASLMTPYSKHSAGSGGGDGGGGDGRFQEHSPAQRSESVAAEATHVTILSPRFPEYDRQSVVLVASTPSSYPAGPPLPPAKKLGALVHSTSCSAALGAQAPLQPRHVAPPTPKCSAEGDT